MGAISGSDVQDEYQEFKQIQSKSQRSSLTFYKSKKTIVGSKKLTEEISNKSIKDIVHSEEKVVMWTSYLLLTP